MKGLFGNACAGAQAVSKDTHARQRMVPVQMVCNFIANSSSGPESVATDLRVTSRLCCCYIFAWVAIGRQHGIK